MLVVEYVTETIWYNCYVAACSDISAFRRMSILEYVYCCRMILSYLDMYIETNQLPPFTDV